MSRFGDRSGLLFTTPIHSRSVVSSENSNPLLAMKSFTDKKIETIYGPSNHLSSTMMARKKLSQLSNENSVSLFATPGGGGSATSRRKLGNLSNTPIVHSKLNRAKADGVLSEKKLKPQKLQQKQLQKNQKGSFKPMATPIVSHVSTLATLDEEPENCIPLSNTEMMVDCDPTCTVGMYNFDHIINAMPTDDEKEMDVDDDEKENKLTTLEELCDLL